MYYEHDELGPINRQATIWRYLSLAKFLAMLEHQALFFSNARHMEDQFEGAFTRRNISAFKELFAECNPSENLQIISSITAGIRRRTFLSCWYMADSESDAMWKLYAPNGDGVAVHSTVASLQMCFHKTQHDVYIGQVEYIDYDEDVIPAHDPVHWFLRKRRAFEHERELRALIIAPTSSNPDHAASNGLSIPVELNTLIHGVHVSPASSEWFKNLVNLLMKKYELKLQVMESTLSVQPADF